MELISIAGLLVLCVCVIGLLALIAAPFVFALCIVGALLKLVCFVLFLPFRLLGSLIGAGIAFVGIGFLLLLGALPLLPFLLIAGGLYLVFRAMRSRPAVSSSPGR